MPYVDPSRRPALDKVYDEMVSCDMQSSIELFLYNLAMNDRQTWPFRLHKLLEKCRSVGVRPNGDINYLLFKYCKYIVKPSYNNYKKYMGDIYLIMAKLDKTRFQDYIDEYREAAEWIRIELLIPYERKKILENGDV